MTGYPDGEGCREERREGGRPEAGREAERQGDTGRQARRQAGRKRIQGEQATAGQARV